MLTTTKLLRYPWTSISKIRDFWQILNRLRLSQICWILALSLINLSWEESCILLDNLPQEASQINKCFKRLIIDNLNDLDKVLQDFKSMICGEKGSLPNRRIFNWMKDTRLYRSLIKAQNNILLHRLEEREILNRLIILIKESSPLIRTTWN